MKTAGNIKRKTTTKAKRKTLRWWIGQLHLWLGLASGLVVLIVSITGCLFVFQKEISESYYNKLYFTKAADAATALPLSALLKNAQQVLGPAEPVKDIIVFRDPGRTVEFLTYKYNDTALSYFGAVEYYRSVFVDPYTGAIKGSRDYKYDFFSVVKYLHWSLLLNTPYGQPIVGWSTLIFVLLLFSGLVLWWPKKWSRALRNRSFKINWKASFKRVNYDLHNVPGFYTLLPALVLGLTGLVFAFGWFRQTVYVVATGTTRPSVQIMVESKPPANASSGATTPTRPTAASSTQPGTSTSVPAAPPKFPIDQAYQASLTALPAALRFNISPAGGKTGVIGILGYRDKETYYGSDQLQFDQYTGRLLNRRNNSEKNKGEKLLEMNYDIHVGAIGGLTGKMIAFLISLVCASLPVTGFIIWWGKHYGKKKHSSSHRAPNQASNPAYNQGA